VNKKWRESETTPSACPYCGRINDRAIHIEGEGTPRAGDVAICISCAGICVFNDALIEEKVSPEQIEALPLGLQYELYKAVVAVRRAHEEIGKP